MPKNVQILLCRGALVFGNSYCTLRARMRQGEKNGCGGLLHSFNSRRAGPLELPLPRRHILTFS